MLPDDTPRSAELPDPATADVQADTAEAQRRRRRQLLRAGAGVVPLSLTLASRPVRAWHCNTTSAWGSAQVANVAASTTARNARNQLGDETWTIREWATNSYHKDIGNPWDKVVGRVWVSNVRFSSVQSAKDSFTVAQLFYGVSGLPKGLTGGENVFAELASKGEAFSNYMIVARLNALFVANAASCLQSTGTDQLPRMLGGTYTPSSGNSASWDSTKIIKYLKDNWIAVPS